MFPEFREQICVLKARVMRSVRMVSRKQSSLARFAALQMEQACRR